MMIIDAHVLAGEAGVCPITALVAIAWMMSRGAGPWYGWQVESTSAAEFVSRYWFTQPDPTPGARFAFSAEDMNQARVCAIVATMSPRAVFACQGGLKLYIY